jgi:hypothetical protein
MNETPEKRTWWEVLRDEQDFTLLFDVNQGFLVDKSSLFVRFINQEYPFELTGLSDQGDPFLVQAHKAALEVQPHTLLPNDLKLSEGHLPLGAIELDGATLVLFEDFDGMRGGCDICFIIPGKHLRTRIPELMVGVQRSDSSKWDISTENEEFEPELLDLKCMATDQVLVSLGTDCQDTYYPRLAFRPDFHQITLSTAEQSYNRLSADTPTLQRLSPRTRL